MTNAIFARHETFHPRYNWLKKGFDQASRDSQAFIRKDAHVNLGVGKNMVRSIRYWCHAFKVLQEDPESSGRRKPSIPTGWGKALLGEDGWDPYLEDLGSLWLLHWELLKVPTLATAWYYAFFVHPRLELSGDELTTGLAEYVERNFPGTNRAVSSLKKDALCILRMYGELPSGTAVTEEAIHCPFAELHLIRPGADSRTYAFRLGLKPGLSSWIIASASLDFAARVESGAQTISLTRLLRDSGSPGLAFKLSESSLYAALEEVVNQREDLNLEGTAGVVQLSFRESPEALSWEFISSHYERANRLEVVA